MLCTHPTRNFESEKARLDFRFGGGGLSIDLRVSPGVNGACLTNQSCKIDNARSRDRHLEKIVFPYT